MKLSDISTISGILGALKINKIADRAVKDTLNLEFLSVRKALSPFEKDRDEMAAKFQEDWSGPITDRKGYDAALKDLNDTLSKMLNEMEADITFSPVKADPLYNPDLWGSEATLGEIYNSVAFLVKQGVAEY